MKLILDGHSLGYEMANLCFLFFPGEKVEQTGPDCERSDNFVITRICRSRTKATALVYIRKGEKSERSICFFDKNAQDYDRQCELALGRAFYKAGSALCGFRPPWGILTGIRPVKLMREKQAEGLNGEEAVRLFEDKYYVSPQKSAICLETAAAEQNIVSLSRPESFSLYISIPFCPSRCAYCSFVSQEIEKTIKLVPEYVRLLCEEIAETGRIADMLGLRLETVYMGGGTPTTLSAGQLAQIFSAVSKAFKLSTVREYTVEAGRPDTITEDKLRAALGAGVTRISVNPQTMNDAVLKAVGRKHTSKDVEDAFNLARRMAVPSINMDLIAGLPGDTPESFAATLERILAMRPEAVTIHTLALKRASSLVITGGAQYNARGVQINGMLSHAAPRLHNSGYHPYYLYRQRNTVGNLENTGWSLPSHEGLYNVFIMDETHSILSVGAGAVTKLKEPGGTRIERVFNFKYPYEYISRFSQIIDRKKQVLKIYEQFGKS